MAKIEVDIPDEIAAYAPDLRYFFETMVRKLHVNRHKGTSKELHLPTMHNYLQREVRELQEALRGPSQFEPTVEAADVANMAFLISSATWHMTRKEFDELYADKPDDEPMVGGTL